MKRRGFTIIELTFVIAIIAILASILFPVFARARETARRAKCANHLQQIGVALSMYAQDSEGHFPRKNNEFGPLYRYMHNVDIFYCPSDSETPYWDIRADSRPGDQSPREIPTRTYSSYVYKGGLCNDDRADRVIAGEFKLLHGELVNVLYLGGYVKGVPTDEYKPVVPPTQKPVEKPAPAPAPGLMPSPGGG